MFRIEEREREGDAVAITTAWKGERPIAMSSTIRMSELKW